MTASDRSVTQQDHVANPKNVADVSHLGGSIALRGSLVNDWQRDLSVGARALFTWICDWSKGYGCAWHRLDTLAKELGIHRRVLCMKRRELEQKGLIRTTYVAKGKSLPTGRIALYQTAVFWPNPPQRVNESTYSINDPIMITDHDRRSETPFCDPILGEAGGGPVPPDALAPMAHPDPYASVATDLLQRWKTRLAPDFDLYRDANAYYGWQALVIARLRDGITKTQCLAAIEAHVTSPHNQVPERRSIKHVFGDLERLELMASLGMRHVPREPETRSKVLAIPTELRQQGTRAHLLDLVSRQKFAVEEIWKTATATMRNGVGLEDQRGFPINDLIAAARQVPVEIETWADFEAWFERTIVEWYATGQRSPKFNATTGALYQWLANNKRHPGSGRPEDIKQRSGPGASWRKEF